VQIDPHRLARAGWRSEGDAGGDQTNRESCAADANGSRPTEKWALAKT
jgi:hypothetical protein